MIVLLFICAFALILIAFFLFAIWRAILGRTGVEVKLATFLQDNNKKLEKTTQAIASFETTCKGNTTAITDVSRSLKAFATALKATFGKDNKDENYK